MRSPNLCFPTLLLAGLLPFLALASAPNDSSFAVKDEAKAQMQPSALRYALDLEAAEVRRLYMEGEFDRAIGLLQSRLGKKGTLEHGDSIFIFKHLGVMYAAQVESVEKGKWFFHKLLIVDTAAKITDMYASDHIYAIFQRISEEASSSRHLEAPTNRRLLSTSPANRPGADSFANKVSASSQLAPHSHGRSYFWLGATTVLAVGAGFATYYVLSEPKLIRGEDYPVP